MGVTWRVARFGVMSPLLGGAVMMCASGLCGESSEDAGLVPQKTCKRCNRLRRTPMDRDLQIWFIVFAAATSVCALIQLSILVGLFLGVRRLRAKLQEIQAMSLSQESTLREMAMNAREALTHLRLVAQNTAEVSERIKSVTNEAAEVSRRQLERADQVISNLLTGVQRFSKYVEWGATEPIHQIRAILAGVCSALSVFFGDGAQDKPHKRGNTSLREWFIVLLILSVFGRFTLRLCAQQPQQPISYEGERVAFVDLVARPGVDVESLRPLILQKAGEPYSNEEIQSSVAALGRTGQFSKVEVEVTPEAAGLRVVFVMQPAFYIGMIYFPGALKVFTYPRLLQVVNYPAEEPY